MSDSEESSEHAEEAAALGVAFAEELRAAVARRTEGSPALAVHDRLTSSQVADALSLCERQLRSYYEASGFTWDNEEKETDLAQEGSVYLVAGDLDGLLQVKVEREEGRWTAYVWEFVVATPGAGLGSTMLGLVEEAAAATSNLAAVALTVQHANQRGCAFYLRRGYVPYFDSVAHSQQFIEAGVPLPPELHKRYILLALELR
jgi:ribosomal protein S18 acetylase RimI-like enzyme